MGALGSGDLPREWQDRRPRFAGVKKRNRKSQACDSRFEGSQARRSTNSYISSEVRTDNGRITNCPIYIREWIRKERPECGITAMHSARSFLTILFLVGSLEGARPAIAAEDTSPPSVTSQKINVLRQVATALAVGS